MIEYVSGATLAVIFPITNIDLMSTNIKCILTQKCTVELKDDLPLQEEK